MSSGEKQVEHILALNHHRDPLDDVLASLRRSAFMVTECRDLPDSQLALDSGGATVLLLNPLVLKRGGVEFELVERVQSEERPVPVIVLVDDAETLAQARQLDVPFLDFLIKPFTPEECVHRIERAVLTRDRFVALRARARELEGQVTVDFKTKLLSQRYFDQLLSIEFKRAQRHHHPLSLVLIDVDDFKAVNDSTEYAFGDEVLSQVAQVLRHNIRETDFAARFGGDEFVLMLPQTTPAEAVQTAIRIRKKVAAHAIQTGSYAVRVTVSIGIDTFDGRADTTPEELRRRANKALQEAKRRGKNQVWLYSPEEQAQST